MMSDKIQLGEKTLHVALFVKKLHYFDRSLTSLGYHHICNIGCTRQHVTMGTTLELCVMSSVYKVLHRTAPYYLEELVTYQLRAESEVHTTNTWCEVL